MFGKFLPQQPIFYDFFEQHAKLTWQAAHILSEFMQTNYPPPQQEVNPIKELEHEADKIAYQCIDTLHKSFITPLQHNDIFRLISQMDDIIDCIDEVWNDCLIYKITLFTPEARDLSHFLVLATDKLKYMIEGLRKRKQFAVSIREHCRQIHQIEDQADHVLRKALGQLFAEEQDLRLLIKWKEIYEKLEEAIDYCDDLSDTIEGIIVEYD
jgi:uncharacterized protein